MANSQHWDTGTGTPSDGNKGVPRIFNKVGGVWKRQWEPSVNVSGSWKQVSKVWTKVSDAWKPVFWSPEIGEELEYGYARIDPYHWYKVYCKVKYLGGDPLDAASWSVNTYTATYQGTTDNAGTTGGWVTGTSGQTKIWDFSGSTHGGDTGDRHRTVNVNIRVGGTDYDDGGSKAAPAGSFMPVFHVYAPGSDPNGSGAGVAVWQRIGYDNATELSHGPTYQASTPWGYSLT